MTAGLALATVGIVWLSRIGVDTGYWSHIFGPELVIAMGIGTVFGPLTSTALVGVEDHDAGVASALVNTAQQIGGSVGVALLNTIAITATASYFVAHGVLGFDPRHPTLAGSIGTVHGYTIAFYVSAGLMALGALVSFVFIRVRKDQLQHAEGVPVGM
jgi:hypothetical protein